MQVFKLCLLFEFRFGRGFCRKQCCRTIDGILKQLGWNLLDLKCTCVQKTPTCWGPHPGQHAACIGVLCIPKLLSLTPCCRTHFLGSFPRGASNKVKWSLYIPLRKVQRNSMFQSCFVEDRGRCSVSSCQCQLENGAATPWFLALPRCLVLGLCRFIA